MDYKNKIENNRINGLPLWAKALLLNALTAFIAIIPFVIRGHGFFAMSNDFNAQQIPFNLLMNSAFRKGDLLWNWNLDLGANLLESMSFYDIGSPFTLLMALLPNTAVPYAIPWMMMLKFAVAGVTSAVYAARFCKYERTALLVSVLYAFSGWQLISSVFYHFQDMAALFPLLLIGMEKLNTEGKKGLMAGACALNASATRCFS